MRLGALAGWASTGFSTFGLGETSLVQLAQTDISVCAGACPVSDAAAVAERVRSMAGANGLSSRRKFFPGKNCRRQS